MSKSPMSLTVEFVRLLEVTNPFVILLLPLVVLAGIATIWGPGWAIAIAIPTSRWAWRAIVAHELDGQ